MEKGSECHSEKQTKRIILNHWVLPQNLTALTKRNAFCIYKVKEVKITYC